MVGRGVDKVAVLDRPTPGGHYRPVPRDALQESQRVLLQRDFKEDLDVVEQDNVTFGLHDDLIEEALELERSCRSVKSSKRRESSRLMFTRGALTRLASSCNTLVLPLPSGPTTRMRRWYKFSACLSFSITFSETGRVMSRLPRFSSQPHRLPPIIGRWSLSQIVNGKAPSYRGLCHLGQAYRAYAVSYYGDEKNIFSLAGDIGSERDCRAWWPQRSFAPAGSTVGRGRNGPGRAAPAPRATSKRRGAHV